ncbi:hypothetical protein BMETH_666_0 [methanotrophic bacterial endosymbiont of Bathymodiolus sp.]|nr:hypothetical protein BMETH_666_0 [methanotrophic bacterial endosymbiont of Bathymodiolus sp.]
MLIEVLLLRKLYLLLVQRCHTPLKLQQQYLKPSL